jgi:hypothetical protein
MCLNLTLVLIVISLICTLFLIAVNMRSSQMSRDEERRKRK